MTSQIPAGSLTSPGPGLLMSDARTEALRPGRTRPWDPAAAGRYLAGTWDGCWHAVERDWADRVAARAGPRASAVPLTVAAVCGQLVTLTRRHGTYDRAKAPVRGNPCPDCAWSVAIAVGSTGRELSFIRPRQGEAAAVARAGADPMLAFRICEAILAAENGPDAAYGLDCPATAQILGYATRHRPVLLSRCEQCRAAGDDRPGADRAGDATGECRCGDSGAICAGCTLWAGSWAGEWQGTTVPECIVTGPCSVLFTLAASYRIPGPLAGDTQPALVSRAMP